MGLSDEDASGLRARVALMRELGVVQWDSITLGPPPRIPTKLEALREEAAKTDSPEAKKAARLEEARAEMRARLNAWDAPDASIDRYLPVELFDP